MSAEVSIWKGVTGGYSDLSETQIPPPPEFLALWVYGMFRSKLRLFMDALGIEDYRITSGFRDPAKNEAVGGERNSAHLHGLGADVVIPAAELLRLGLSRRAVAQKWEDATGGFAQDEGDHVHFNLPRSAGWAAIRFGAVLLVLVLLIILVLVWG